MQHFVFINERALHQPMVSVCCICNQQRAMDDTWEPLEISRATDEILTHGFCPDCIREYYPHISFKVDKVFS